MSISILELIDMSSNISTREANTTNSYSTGHPDCFLAIKFCYYKHAVRIHTTINAFHSYNKASLFSCSWKLLSKKKMAQS